ncbi:hypothetical protein [Lactiplantibacillus plantarum]|uniref:hypothetical protein n=1 Tax=Lactiplantibacillus plantarum TaxID=1590 RepID=UPI000E4CBA7D|nr:hypothetical protein [Lactiplantibacillus plantarum]QDJ17479.1 hypothetical protein CL175_10295 [Lactiplantibacillus plantarum]RHF45744.1 hypothetical protein DW678_07090 [Lactiplantibacillus plantarum]
MRQDVKKIRNLLKQYAKLKRDLTAFNQVSSPVLSMTPSHGSGNGVETGLISYVDLSYRIKKIEDAINALDSRDQFILIEYVMYKHYSRDEMCQKLSVSHSGFNYLKNQSLRNFQLINGEFDSLNLILKT